MASFLASIPEIQSAIKVGGDGMRLQLDIPESEMEKAMPVFGMRRRVLAVTIEDEGDIRVRRGLPVRGEML